MHSPVSIGTGIRGPPISRPFNIGPFISQQALQGYLSALQKHLTQVQQKLAKLQGHSGKELSAASPSVLQRPLPSLHPVSREVMGPRGGDGRASLPGFSVEDKHPTDGLLANIPLLHTKSEHRGDGGNFIRGHHRQLSQLKSPSQSTSVSDCDGSTFRVEDEGGATARADESLVASPQPRIVAHQVVATVERAARP
jgi:hypothetical protein